MSTISLFKGIENNHEYKECIKKVCESLMEHAMKKINFKKKKMKLLTNKHKMQKFAIFVMKNLKINILKMKKYCKVRDHCHYTAEYISVAHSICNLKSSILKKFLFLYIPNGKIFLSVKTVISAVFNTQMLKMI